MIEHILIEQVKFLWLHSCVSLPPNFIFISRRYSCDVPVGEIEGKSVETAEGLQREPNDPLFRAFIKNQAGQCGYCLSGILMASKALLRKDPFVSRAKIAKALDGNLCRCGAHKRILDAIEEAAKSVEDNA